MSSNKGKDGEMNALITFAIVAKNEENFDLTRPTTTNTPDMGADIILEHKENFIENTMLPLSTKKIPNTTPNTNTKVKLKNEKTRIDIKTTEKKLSKDTVEKFISDTRKHPDCTNHMLIGGQNLTSPAKKRLDKANEDLKEDKKKLYYLNNGEMKNISDHYKKLETQNKNSNKSLDKNI
ncbi:hypothetical protein ACOL3A_05410 [Aliarcobacter butzleri]